MKKSDSTKVLSAWRLRRGACRSAVCFLIAVAGCGPNPNITSRRPETPAVPSRHRGAGRFYDPRGGLSIVPPSGYRDNGESALHLVSFLGPSEGDFTVNFVVNSRPFDGAPLEQAAPRANGIMALLLKDYALADSGPTAIDGKDAYRMSGTFLWKGRKMRNLQYFVPGGRDEIYVVTFAAPVDVFDKYRDEFERTARTLRTD